MLIDQENALVVKSVEFCPTNTEFKSRILKIFAECGNCFRQKFVQQMPFSEMKSTGRERLGMFYEPIALYKGESGGNRRIKDQ
jgi:hypothetical protein